MAKRKPAPKGYRWAKAPGPNGRWHLAPKVVGGKPPATSRPTRPAGAGMHWEKAPNSNKWRIQPNVIGKKPGFNRKPTVKAVAKVGANIIKNVKPAGSKGSTHVAHATPQYTPGHKVVTQKGGAEGMVPKGNRPKGGGKVRPKGGKGIRTAPRGVQRGPGGQPQQAPAGYGMPEMPDFFQGVHDVPSYDQLYGSTPSVDDLLGMVSGGGSQGGYNAPRVSYQTGGSTVAGIPGGTTPVANNVNSLAQGLTSSLGGAANQGTQDSLAYADALSSGIPASFPTAGTPGYSLSGTSGSSGGGGGGGRSSNPYVDAARLQKMYQAEQMFGPKLMAEFLKNQGYEIKNAKDYQSAWMDAAGFPLDYAYKVGKNQGQQLRNQATALSTAVVRSLAGPKIAKANQDVRGARARTASTRTRTNLAVKRDARQAAMDQARYNKTIAEINKVNKTKPEAQRVNIDLSKQVGYAVDSAGHRIKTSAAVNAAFAKGPTGKGKVKTYGLTPSTYTKTVTAATVAAKHMHQKNMPYGKAILALMGLKSVRAPRALATKIANTIYKPGGLGRKAKK